MNPWPILTAAAVVVGALVLAAVIALAPFRLARRRPSSEPRRPAYREPSEARPPAEPCPGCPRCTGVGTFGMTAMDRPEPAEPAEIAPVMPLRKRHRDRKAA